MRATRLARLRQAQARPRGCLDSDRRRESAREGAGALTGGCNF
jgi:hypothetical protein